MSLFQKTQSTSPMFNTGGSLFANTGPTATTPSLFSSITGSNNPGGLFAQPGGQTGGLFGQTAPAPTAGGSLFGNTAQPGGNTGLFSQNTGNTGNAPSLFNPSGNTGGLFGQPASTGGLFSQTTQGANPGGSLFNAGAPGQNTSLFSQPAGNTQNAGLFSQNPGNAGGQFNTQPGGLFGANTSAGGLLSMNPANPSSLFSGNQNTGGLFGQSGAGGGGLFGNNQSGLFTQNANPGGLFGQNNSGSLFGQNPAGGLFNNNPTAAFQGGQPGPINFTPQESPSSQLIENLSQTLKENCYTLRKFIDDNETYLTQSESLLASISKYKQDLKLKLTTLFIFSRKVQTAEKRCKVTVDVIKKFQCNINNFIKDAVKVFNQCEYADSYHQIESPANFLADMLGCCEERLKVIEDNFKEVQELMSIQSGNCELNMLINTISLMQEKFELVSSVAYDVHKKVTELLVKQGVVVESEKKKEKISTFESSKKFSSIQDIIAGRPSYQGYH